MITLISLAAQRPSKQRQPPPQSMVPGWHTCVHIMSPQAFAFSLLVHAEA